MLRLLRNCEMVLISLFTLPDYADARGDDYIDMFQNRGFTLNGICLTLAVLSKNMHRWCHFL